MIFLAREGDGTRQRPQPPRLTVWITFSSDRERERERERVPPAGGELSNRWRVEADKLPLKTFLYWEFKCYKGSQCDIYHVDWVPSFPLTGSCSNHAKLNKGSRYPGTPNTSTCLSQQIFVSISSFWLSVSVPASLLSTYLCELCWWSQDFSLIFWLGCICLIWIEQSVALCGVVHFLKASMVFFVLSSGPPLGLLVCWR